MQICVQTLNLMHMQSNLFSLHFFLYSCHSPIYTIHFEISFLLSLPLSLSLLVHEINETSNVKWDYIMRIILEKKN